MFHGNKVALRSLQLEDAPTITRYFNNFELRQFLASITPVAKEEEEEWIKRTWEGRKTGRHYCFGIELKETKELIGTVDLMNVDLNSRVAELGIALWQPKHWGKGFGTESMTLILDFGFCYLGLHTIFLFYLERNKRGRRAYEKLGFKPAGKLREMRIFENKREDLFFMDLLAEEWNGPRLLRIPDSQPME